MTEEEWLRAEEVETLLEYLRSRRQASERKLRLLVVALCRRWDLFTDQRLLRVLDVAEEHADGRAEEQTRAEGENVALDTYERELDQDNEYGVSCYPTLRLIGKEGYTCTDATGAASLLVTWACYAEEDWARDGYSALALEQVSYLRCIFGNPFRPVTFSAAWRTDTVLALAQGMYESRDFSAMPILADALQDQGCTDEAILAHCRGAGPHVRGCHVLDAILNKS
jgi:hypothetical protein